ncbi:hypothetical protein BU16DRAFT_512265 [Lophium mytilinum]|uniref:Zn(2)-C6 fungal-type domain-containing protein n=1 Tax=Lophium mytilinum TaxID=390894 RepID=A0A6A6QNS9_9PEZI|nr:hypothetical protein BU16DRAFT_512265 [Lophium mytilinum]
MAPKRALDHDALHDNKLPKLEQSPGSPLTQSRAESADFSNSVKKKLSASSRTGQACDRCKIRKIRCDGRAGGCSPCLQNNTPCKTTDRITGRATTRGHTEALESQVNSLRNHVAELQAQLKELGVEPKPFSGYNSYTPAAMQSQTLQWAEASSSGNNDQMWSTEQAPASASVPPLAPYRPSGDAPLTSEGVESKILAMLPAFKSAAIGDNYLGISSADSLLSPIKGTSLSVFGTEIDITDFVDGETDYESSPQSYGHFLSVVLGHDQNVEPLQFPEYHKLNEYATWYLRSLNPYTMALDRASFTQLIWRIYHEPGFTPSPAETVMVHMMLAILKYQIAKRNHDEVMFAESNKHYRYSLSFFGALLRNHSLPDVQAMLLICIHLRNFPKPGAAWLMCWMTFAVAVELGFHRSIKAWADTAAKKDILEVEMRKRVFWTLYALNVSLSGKLGRPMPIRMEDIDVEFPEIMDDCIQGEQKTDFHKCSFQVGVQTAKTVPMYSKMYSTLYTVRPSPNSYEETVRALEASLRRWREGIPLELSDRQANQESYIFSRYLEFWELEFTLLLHHPAVCRSSSPEFMKSNLDICLDASQKMLHNVNELRRFKSLDIVWINCTTYIAAIFTTLFIHSQRKDSMTSADMHELRKDMDLWLDAMGECGELLGSGLKLRNAISKIVEHSLANINGHLAKRTTEAVARAALSQTPQQQANPGPNAYENSAHFHSQYTNAPPGDADSKPTPNYLPSVDPSMGSATNIYPGASAVFPYSNGTATTLAPYQGNNNSFDQPNYAGVTDPGMSAAHVAAIQSAASGNPPPTPENFIYGNNTTPNTAPQHYPSHNDAWQQWTRANVTPIEPHDYSRPQEYLNTANTLMALGGRDGVTPTSGQEGVASAEGSSVAAQTSSWPMMIFGIGPNGNMQSQ